MKQYGGVVTAIVWMATRIVCGQTLPELRSHAVEQQGQAYLDSRGAILALDIGAFEEVLAPLRAGGATPAEHIVGRALDFRRQQATASARFDEQLAQANANPDRSSIGGNSQYDVKALKRQDHSLDSLLFETLLKRNDLPRGLRWRLMPPLDAVGWAYAEGLEPCFALTLVDDAPLVDLAVTITMLAKQFPDNRVFGVLVTAYEKERSLRAESPSGRATIMDCVAKLGGAQGRDALRELKAFEHDALVVEGVSPWDDTTANARLASARTALVNAEKEDAHSPAATITALRSSYRSAELAVNRRRLWDDLCNQLATLESQFP